MSRKNETVKKSRNMESAREARKAARMTRVANQFVKGTKEEVFYFNLSGMVMPLSFSL